MQKAPADYGTIHGAVREEIRPLAELVAADPQGTPVVLETLAERCARAHAGLAAIDRPSGQPDEDISTAEAIVAAAGAAAALAAGSVAVGAVVEPDELGGAAGWLIRSLWTTWEDEAITRRW